MRRTEDIEIDGETYELTQVPVRDGQRLQLKMVKALARGLEPLTEGQGGDVLSGAGLSKIALEAVAKGLATAIVALPEEDYQFAIDLMANNCCVVREDGKRPKLGGTLMDTHFAGRHMHLTKWLVACVRWNYADFFGDSAVTAALDLLRERQPSKSPPDSTGGSGE